MKKTLLAYTTFLCASLSAYDNPILEGYWESWNYTDSMEAIVSMEAEVVNISFATLTPLGNHTFTVTGVEADEERLLRFIQLAHRQGKRVKLSVGGATYSLSGILLSDADAYGMAAALADYVCAYALDGVDFDIEDYPAAHLQSALISYTRHLLGEEALITYTPKAPASSTLPYLEVIERSHADLDGINIMCYDAWPGYSYQEDSLALIDLGVPREKVVIGLMPGLDDLGHPTTINDLIDAANWVKGQRLGGIMLWDLNRDLQNLTGLGSGAASKSIRKVLDSPITPR